MLAKRRSIKKEEGVFPLGYCYACFPDQENGSPIVPDWIIDGSQGYWNEITSLFASHMWLKTGDTSGVVDSGQLKSHSHLVRVPSHYHQVYTSHYHISYYRTQKSGTFMTESGSSSYNARNYQYSSTQSATISGNLSAPGTQSLSQNGSGNDSTNNPASFGVRVFQRIA